VFGSRGDDVLAGTEKGNAIIGRKGNDELFGNGGNDWLHGGRGDDLLDGGAGNDTVYGGSGNDIAVYSMAENASTDACGRGDFYDGGKGTDVLRLILTPEELANAAVQDDIAAFQAFLADNPSGCGGKGEIFEFTSIDLAVRNFEELEIDGGNAPPAGTNTAPVGVDDVVETLEDEPVVINVISNDTDADGDALTAVVVDGPAHGALVANADGTFTYTPEADYNSNYGPDGFTYRASDGVDESALTNVVIDVTPVNDAPRMVGEPNWGTLDTSSGNSNIRIDILALYAPGPSDESDQAIALDFDALLWTTYGLAGKTPDNMISYTAFGVPPAGYEILEYTIVDDAGGSSTANLQVDVI
jgi:VCBS repeat-containing protein